MNDSLFEPLPTPEEMAAWDKTAIEKIGVRQEVLMENAGRECMAALEMELGDVAGMSALILAGSGNNGGDALVLARLLRNKGAEVMVFRKGNKNTYKGASAYNLRLVENIGVKTYNLSKTDPEALPMADIVVDGLLGTGFHGELREDYRALVEAVNELGYTGFVMSVDIPSGLNGLTGRPSPIAVRADATVTFHAAKLGLALPGSGAYTGVLYVGDIGIPGIVMEHKPPGCRLVTESVAQLYPDPLPSMHKGTAGHVLVVGGSRGLTGAPLLAALGALRGGAGLATVACPDALSTEIKSGFPDVMTLPLGDNDTWSAETAGALAKDMERFDSLLIGPGIGRDDGAREFMRAILSKSPPRPVVDADGLYWLARDPELMDALPGDTILTPHPGEMARLLDTDTATVQNDRLGAARKLAAESGVAVVLKGAGTLIAAPDGRALLTPIDAPNLAVGGAGDVLAGLLATLAARGLEPMSAAALATYWHARAGKLTGEEYPCRGNLAREIADALPQTMKELKKC
jgi:NAD(P)H-hydrate epimerase